MNDENDENKIDLLKQFQVNNNIMKLTRDSCVFMHCLPSRHRSHKRSNRK